MKTPPASCTGAPLGRFVLFQTTCLLPCCNVSDSCRFLATQPAGSGGIGTKVVPGTCKLTESGSVFLVCEADVRCSVSARGTVCIGVWARVGRGSSHVTRTLSCLVGSICNPVSFMVVSFNGA